VRKIFTEKWSSVIWLVVRVWLGYQWLEAGLHKFSDPKWMVTGEALKGFLSKAAGLIPNVPAGAKYDWYKAFTASLVNSGAYTWFAKLVVFGEILTGIALILGVVTTFAAVVGAFMNLNFMLAGSASSNPVMYTLEILLILAGINAGLIGLDYYVVPFLRKLFSGAYRTVKEQA